MTKFESPEISVVMFSAEDTVLTASTGGYESNKNEGTWDFNLFSLRSTDGPGDDAMPL